MTETSGENRVADAGQQGLVTVVIPCYNQASYLGEAIESVRAQTYRGFEIVVVDDGSTDATAAVAGSHPEVRLLRQRNAGLSAARNAGLELSRGGYLVFLDADDRLLPNALRDGVDSLARHPEAAFTSGHFRFIRGDGSTKSEFAQEPIECPPYEGMLRGNYIGMHSTVMFRRAIFDKVGSFDTSLHSCEDYDLYMRITRRYAVARHDRLVAEYRRHDASMSVRAGRMLDTALDVLAAQRPFIRGNGRLIGACQAGIRGLRRDLIRPLLSGILGAVRTSNWSRAARLSMQLPTYVAPCLRATWLDLRLTLERITAGQGRAQA
jgi:glycosyltransferase involved in cell wall biosynthesis